MAGVDTVLKQCLGKLGIRCLAVDGMERSCTMTAIHGMHAQRNHQWLYGVSGSSGDVFAVGDRPIPL